MTYPGTPARYLVQMLIDGLPSATTRVGTREECEASVQRLNEAALTSGTKTITWRVVQWTEAA